MTETSVVAKETPTRLKSETHARSDVLSRDSRRNENNRLQDAYNKIGQVNLSASLKRLVKKFL